jgi:hypothetical protein
MDWLTQLGVIEGAREVCRLAGLASDEDDL